MKVAVSTSRSLGTKCWSAQRFVGPCSPCSRYGLCALPERVAHVEYDAILAKARAARTESENLFAQAKKVAGV